MAMTRAQLRHQAACARYQADKRRPPTRKQTKRWLEPIRKAFIEMRSGYVDAVQGYAVTRLHTGDDYARIDYCINGFVGMISRLFPDFDVSAMNAVSKKLANGIPLVVEEIEACIAVVDKVAELIMKTPRQALIDASLTEQINIELEQSSIKSAA